MPFSSQLDPIFHHLHFHGCSSSHSQSSRSSQHLQVPKDDFGTSLSSIECESCPLRKHTHVSFPKCLDHRTKFPFEFVHTNVWGHSRTASTLGFRYFVTFIDDYFRCTWLFLMKNRAKLFSIFQKFFAKICTQFNTFIRILRSDNALKYILAPFSSFCPYMGSFIKLLTPTLPNIMLSTRTVI